MLIHYIQTTVPTFPLRAELHALGLLFDGERKLWYALPDEGDRAEMGAALVGGDATVEMVEMDELPPKKKGRPFKKGWKGAKVKCIPAPAPDAPDAPPQPLASAFPAPLETPAPSGAPLEAAHQLAALLAQLVASGAHPVDSAAVARIVAEAVAPLAAKVEALAERPADAPRSVTVTVNDLPPVTLDEHTHRLLGDVVGMLKLGKSVALIGPAGCGKSMLAKQAARVLGRRFGFVDFSEGVEEAHLFGFRQPTGDGMEYVIPETSFADCYENGGIWCGDEFDNANPNVLVAVNGALANGHLSLPKRFDRTVAARHADFGMVATLNTWGTGPNATYSGRNRLDGSTLDRFRAGMFEMEYSRDLETALCPDATLRTAVWKVRDAVVRLSMERIVSTRLLRDLYDCRIGLGWSVERCMQQVTLGWSAADVQKVR